MDKSDYAKKLEEMYSVDGMSKQGTPTDSIDDISFDGVLGTFQNEVKMRSLYSIDGMSRRATKKITKDLLADAATYTALDELRNHDCDEDSEKNIRFKAKETAEKLSATFIVLRKTGSITDADGDSYSPLKRIILGNTGLKLQVCEINLDQVPLVADQIDMQMSSIVVDAIIFLNHIAGVQILINELNFDHIVGVVKKFLHQKQKLLENLEQILQDREMNVTLIKRVIILGCNAYEDGIFWLIVKKLYADFDMSQKTLNVAQISAFIGTLVVSNGFEVLAKLLEPLVEVRGFVTKLNHLAAVR